MLAAVYDGWRARLARWQLTRPERAEYATSGHPLLSALGTQTRDFIELLHDIPGESQSFEHYERPRGDHLIARLQGDILDLVEQPEKRAVDAADESVQVHVCHSRQREIEDRERAEEHRYVQPER